MAESNATERYEHCIRHHSRTCTCGIVEDTRQKPLSVEVTREGCMSYAAAEAADGDPDCTTGQPLDMAPRCPECGQPAHSPGDCYVPVPFQDGYIKGAADCAGITAKTDVGAAARSRDVPSVQTPDGATRRPDVFRGAR